MNANVRVIADDLTGALDSAVAFLAWQERHMPLPVFPSTNTVSGVAGNAALNLNNRDVAAPVTDLAEAAGFFAAADHAYCKIDSLLRGFPAQHTGLCVRERGCQLVVVAPAFPAQGRITQQGVVYASGQPLTAASERFTEGLHRLGLPVQHITKLPTTLPKPDTLPKQGILFCDAEDDSDLQQVVKCVLEHHPPQNLLWVGSGGLARALAHTITPEINTPSQPLTTPSLGLPLLFVIASFHPVTLQQLDMLRTLSAVRSLAEIDSTFSGDASVILAHIDVAALSREQASQHLTKQLEALTTHHSPPYVVVSGGDTLAHLCAVTDTQTLDLVGEYQAGMPLFRFRGGRWHGTLGMSKSGAFGQADVYRQLVHQLLADPHHSQQRKVL